jgi:hypothetical protein
MNSERSWNELASSRRRGRSSTARSDSIRSTRTGNGSCPTPIASQLNGSTARGGNASGMPWLRGWNNTGTETATGLTDRPASPSRASSDHTDKLSAAARTRLGARQGGVRSKGHRYRGHEGSRSHAIPRESGPNDSGAETRGAAFPRFARCSSPLTHTRWRRRRRQQGASSA